jgi:hypothetical protein
VAKTGEWQKWKNSPKKYVEFYVVQYRLTLNLLPQKGVTMVVGVMPIQGNYHLPLTSWAPLALMTTKNHGDVIVLQILSSN